VVNLGANQLSQPQMRQAKGLFQSIDANNSQQLDPEEVQALRLAPSEVEPEEVWDRLDTNQDGFIDLREWSSFLGSIKAAKVRDLQEDHMPKGTALRHADRHVQAFLDHVALSLQHPEVAEARAAIIAAKEAQEEEYGTEFKGSFLGRNKLEGNVGMHHTQARGKVQSHIDEVAMLRGASTPWALNPAEASASKKLFNLVDEDHNRLLDPSELAEKFCNPRMWDLLEANEDGVVSLPEWMKFMRGLKLEVWEGISTSPAYQDQDLKSQVDGVQQAFSGILENMKLHAKAKANSPARSVF